MTLCFCLTPTDLCNLLIFLFFLIKEGVIGETKEKIHPGWEQDILNEVKEIRKQLAKELENAK